MVKLRNKLNLLNSFKTPVIVLVGIIAYLTLSFLGFKLIADILVIGVILLGSYSLFKETVEGFLARHFALDYIAILAIVVAFVTREYLVGSVIALMLTSGRTLEEYSVSQAKKTLTSLIDRIPDRVLLWKARGDYQITQIKKIEVGQKIFIRKGEVIPLDGELESETGITDESSLTGEPYGVEKLTGDAIRSGTVNIGEPIVVRVTRTEQNSTYNKIVEMVRKAQNEKAPLVRLADKYSTVFTLVTLVIAGLAYFYTHSLERILSVLVIATPCPLILATPIALIGGVNAAAKRRIIIKKLAALEVLSRIKAIVFDKTGTITLGIPIVSKFESNTNIGKIKLLSIASAIERNSLHPLAKAVVLFAKNQKALVLPASNIEEKVGSGISGLVLGRRYTLSKLPGEVGMEIGVFEGKKLLGRFYFEDQIKKDSVEIVKNLKDSALKLFIFTGDKLKAAEKVVESLGESIMIRAGLSPEEKLSGIEGLQKQGLVTAMIGDGINDAPALAKADVGLVFSNEEQTSASEAADIVFLGGNFTQVKDVIGISKQTIRIALQSIGWGIGMSIFGMVLASFGLIPPIMGAVVQEGIDVAVIINALRARNY